MESSIEINEIFYIKNPQKLKIILTIENYPFRPMIRSLKHHQQMLLLHHHIQQQQLKEVFSGQKFPSHHIRLKRTDSLEIERADSPAISR
jgi:hypothetical protein